MQTNEKKPSQKTKRSPSKTQEKKTTAPAAEKPATPAAPAQEQAPASPPMSLEEKLALYRAANRNVLILDVPYAEKDVARAAGAWWDPKNLVYTVKGNKPEFAKLDRWIPTPERADEIAARAKAKVEERARAAHRVYLDNTVEENDQVKKAGARFDGDKKLWYVEPDSDLSKVQQWIPTPERLKEILAEREARANVKVLDVPYGDKEVAKAAGAKYDGKERQWYVPPGTDPETLKDWMPLNDGARKAEAPALNALAVKPQTHNAFGFAGTWFNDKTRENVMFPHRDPENPKAKIEVHEVAGKTPSAEALEGRSFWMSSGPKQSNLKKVVFVESAVDALSYHQISGDDHTRYVSTGGGPLTEQQKAILANDVLFAQVSKDPKDPTKTIAVIPEKLVVVGAFSNSKLGTELSKELNEIITAKNLAWERNTPTHGRTWNDVLQLKERDYLRSLGVKQESPGLAVGR